MTGGVLAGVRVLDLAGPIAAYCTRLLTDLGAEVVMVESPAGDRLRRVPPFLDGGDPRDDSLLFGYYRAGQRAVTLDLGTEVDRRRLEGLGGGADVVIVSPSAREPLPGWDPASRTLAWASNEAVVCALSPFGLTGPHRDWRATSMTSFAVGGTMVRVGPVEGPPVTVPGRQQWDEAGIHAALAVLAGLHARPTAGGQLVEIAVQEIAVMRDMVIERYSATGMDPGGRNVPLGIPPTGTLEAGDGPFEVAAYQHGHWEAFLDMLGHPAVLSEPSLADPMLRRELFDGLRSVIEGLVADQSREELVARGQRAGLPCSVQHTPTEFVADPQPTARQAFVPTPISGGATVAMPGPGFRTEPSLTVDRSSLPPAPAAATVVSGWAPRPTHPVSGAGPDRPGGPLAGVRVLTFGAFAAGATVGCLLAELGADVVKIEARSRPEVLRTPAHALGDTATEPSGVTNTLLYASFNRSVRNLSLEMGREDGRALFRRLVPGVDIVIENFGVGVLDRWGCDYHTLLERNPALVLTSISGYGRTGPRATDLAYGQNISSFTALTYAWGHAHITHSDYLSGQHAALATVAALRQAQATGAGVRVDVAHTEALAAVMPGLLLDALANGRDAPPPGNTVAGSLLSGVYEGIGHDAWVALELEEVPDWNLACAVVGRDDLVISTAADATDGQDELEVALGEWCGRWTSHTAVHLLQRAGIAAGVVQTPEDVWRDPQLRSRGTIVELDQPDLGPHSYWANPYRFTVTQPGPSSAGARLGGHTKAVLEEWLALGDEEIDSLVSSGAVFQG